MESGKKIALAKAEWFSPYNDFGFFPIIDTQYTEKQLLNFIKKMQELPGIRKKVAKAVQFNENKNHRNKTRIFNIINGITNADVGQIKWCIDCGGFGFAPDGGTAWEIDSLHKIARKIIEMKQEYNNKKIVSKKCK